MYSSGRALMPETEVIESTAISSALATNFFERRDLKHCDFLIKETY